METYRHKTPFEILGVSRNATLAEIKRKYMTFSRIFHPDKLATAGYNSEKMSEMTEKYNTISHAYNVLSDDNQRAVWLRLDEECMAVQEIQKAWEESDYYNLYDLRQARSTESEEDELWRKNRQQIMKQALEDARIERETQELELAEAKERAEKNRRARKAAEEAKKRAEEDEAAKKHMKTLL